jgi:FeS assembly SUF system protein
MGLLSWITGGGREARTPTTDPAPVVPTQDREPEPWVTSALTGEPPDDPMKQLPVIQPHADTADAPPAPVASEPKTAGLVDDADRHAALEPDIVAAMRTVFDPEIPVNIYDLGLIYDIIVEASGVVGVHMTLTAPNCPAAQWLPGQVEDKVRRVAGVTDVKLDVVFDPPWDKDRMSDAAKLQLGMW